MLDSVEWIKIMFTGFPMLKYLFVFLGTAFGGEIFLITFAFLAAQGMMPLFFLFILAFLGTYFSDTMWFLVGRIKTKSIFEHRYTTITLSVISETIKKISRGSYFWTLVFAKFLFGTRIVTIIYVSKRGLSLKKFLHYNAWAVIFWVLVIVPIGYMSGLGFTYLAHVLENVYAGVGFLFLVLVLIVFVQVWVQKSFSEMGQNGGLEK